MLSIRDKKIVWHPFTQEKMAAPPIAIKRASGLYLYDENDQSYVDLISSWWVNLHGHAHPDIAHAIYRQALAVEQVMFAGFTHEPAVQLCEGLSRCLPGHLNRFFFSDNGSTSVEIALKMAYQYWCNQGSEQRTLFISFEGGYHGDTFGAMSVGVDSGFHKPFSPYFFDVITIPFPATWHNDEKVEEKESRALTLLADLLDKQGSKIAAMIIEPLVQGAAGMRMCRQTFIQQVTQLVQAHNILVIFDEVMTGFYRTGKFFALEHVSVVPDLLCLSKGLTGGFLPMALTVAQEKIYQSFLSEHYSTAFLHGHSYTANPLGCAAANASLNLLAQSSTLSAIHAIACAHKEGLGYLQQSFSFICRTRTIGTIAAFDISQEKYAYANTALTAAFLNAGLLLRPLGSTVYLIPPYIITPAELNHAYEKICRVLKKLSI